MHSIIANRKFAWAAGILLFALYFGPSPLRFFVVPPPRPAPQPQQKLGKPSPIPSTNGAAPAVAGIIPATAAPADPSSPAAPPAAVAASDPALAKLAGKWSGSAYIQQRGNCSLTLALELSGDSKSERPYQASSGLSCAPTFMEIMADASRNAGRKVTPAEELNKLNKRSTPTEASFTGVAQDNAIKLIATDNVGVKLNPNNCEMLSIGLRALTGGGMSVKWQEAERGNCHGGEMVMTRNK